MSDWVDVASVDDFPVGSRRAVDVEDVMILVFNIDGEYHAIEDVCTHDYSSLDDGTLEGDEIILGDVFRRGAKLKFQLPSDAPEESLAYTAPSPPPAPEADPFGFGDEAPVTPAAPATPAAGSHETIADFDAFLDAPKPNEPSRRPTASHLNPTGTSRSSRFRCPATRSIIELETRVFPTATWSPHSGRF